MTDAPAPKFANGTEIVHGRHVSFLVGPSNQVRIFALAGIGHTNDELPELNISESGKVIEVTELYAVHEVWGPSSGGKGRLHVVHVEDLVDADFSHKTLIGIVLGNY